MTPDAMLRLILTTRQFLHSLGYFHQRECDNPAYEMFLAGS